MLGDIAVSGGYQYWNLNHIQCIIIVVMVQKYQKHRSEWFIGGISSISRPRTLVYVLKRPTGVLRHIYNSPGAANVLPFLHPHAVSLLIL
jgi:hypothetical protein